MKEITFEFGGYYKDIECCKKDDFNMGQLSRAFLYAQNKSVCTFGIWRGI